MAPIGGIVVEAVVAAKESEGARRDSVVGGIFAEAARAGVLAFCLLP